MEVLFYSCKKVFLIYYSYSTTTLTVGVILIHDTSSSKPCNNIAHNAINFEINGKVVVCGIGRSGYKCPDAECIPKCLQCPSTRYNKYSKCRK